MSFGQNNVEDGLARKHWLQLRNLEMLHEEGYLTRQEFKVRRASTLNVALIRPTLATTQFCTRISLTHRAPCGTQERSAQLIDELTGTSCQVRVPHTISPCNPDR